jgi:hypothetical protein
VAGVPGAPGEDHQLAERRDVGEVEVGEVDPDLSGLVERDPFEDVVEPFHVTEVGLSAEDDPQGAVITVDGDAETCGTGGTGEVGL